jgi:GH15 family glucan-1,4-alpha-glucosidase
MAVWGLDVEQVRQLSTQLNRQADAIQQALGTLTSALQGTQWSGPDAEKFRNDWSSSHTSALKSVISALQEAAQLAARNAGAQEQASNS